MLHQNFIPITFENDSTNSPGSIGQATQSAQQQPTQEFIIQCPGI